MDIIKSMLEKAKKHISDNGYGKGSNFTVNSIAYLIVGFAKPLIYELDKLQTDQKVREHSDNAIPEDWIETKVTFATNGYW